MFRQLSRWFGKGRQDPWGSGQLHAWAEQQGWEIRSSHPGQSLVLERTADSDRCRLEWGPTQRFYIGGPELRLRAELPSTWTAQMVIMNRGLRRQLEREVFEEYVEYVHTRVDTSTPPEMRLLVMLPKVENAWSSESTPLSVLATDADRADRALAGSLGDVLSEWPALDAKLGIPSEATTSGPEVPDRPLVVLLSGRKLTWRTRMDSPTPERLDAVQDHFQRLRLALMA